MEKKRKLFESSLMLSEGVTNRYVIFVSFLSLWCSLDFIQELIQGFVSSPMGTGWFLRCQLPEGGSSCFAGAKYIRTCSWACDSALASGACLMKRLQEYVFSPNFFFSCPFRDEMKTWHFLQQSSKPWRMWKLGWRPGSTLLETPSCIIQQVRHASRRRAICLGLLTPDSAYPPSDRTALTGATALFLLRSSGMCSCYKSLLHPACTILEILLHCLWLQSWIVFCHWTSICF